MDQPVNHEEALMLAQIKEPESNLARCYIDQVNRSKAADARIAQLEKELQDCVFALCSEGNRIKALKDALYAECRGLTCSENCAGGHYNCCDGCESRAKDAYGPGWGEAAKPRCATILPLGWRCEREAGHDGNCAASRLRSASSSDEKQSKVSDA
jgi:hypothetical protein